MRTNIIITIVEVVVVVVVVVVKVQKVIMMKEFLLENQINRITKVTQV